jgi:type I restriction enzyme R subunit
MNLRQEHHPGREICAHPGANGWLYSEGEAALFNRASGLFLPDLLVWVETTQPENWQSLTKTHGVALAQMLAERIRKNMNEFGTRFTLHFALSAVAVTNASAASSI